MVQTIKFSPPLIINYFMSVPAFSITIVLFRSLLPKNQYTDITTNTGWIIYMNIGCFQKELLYCSTLKIKLELAYFE